MMFRIVRLMLATFALSLIGTEAAHATVPAFVGAGPGMITVTEPTAGTTRLVYGVDSMGPDTFTLTAVATTTGTKTFSYTSSGYYSFFQVRAAASAFSNGLVTTLYNYGPVNCCTAPSSGFSYSGLVTLDLVAGQTYGFSLTGSNGDSANRIQGQLDVSAVPEPASWAMLLAGFGMIGFTVRRRTVVKAVPQFA